MFSPCSDFYRARVENLPKGEKKFKVMLVDYGIIEHVDRDDIFTKVIGTNVPVQTQKFRLSSVVPLSCDDNEWPQSTLDFIHGEIVDFNCLVTVSGLLDGVNECSIVVQDNEVDIEKLLVEQGLASFRKPSDAYPPAKKPTEELEELNDSDELKRLEEKVRAEKFKKCLDDFELPPIVYEPPEETANFLKRCDENFNTESSRSALSLTSVRLTRAKSERQRTSFEPENSYELNPRRKHRARRPPKIVSFFDLQAADIKEFSCTLAQCDDLPIVHVTPNFPELTEEIDQMQKLLDIINEGLLVPFSHPERTVQNMCLVKIANEWKRGQVITVFPTKKCVDVFLFDVATTASVRFENLRKLPQKIRNFPKQTLAVVLAGITVIKRPEPEIIFQQFPMDTQMKAIVKDFDDKDYPLVDLVVDGQLVYQFLIEANYFVKR